MNTRIVYKVCLVRGGLNQSARFGTVHYAINRKVAAPENTRLFCFETYEAAENFRDRHHEAIFKARAEGISRPSSIAECYGSISPYWRAKQQKKSIQKVQNIRLKTPPAGTLFAKTITLLERV